MKAADSLAESVVVPQAESRDDGQAFRLRQPAALEHGANARRIDGDRFLGEDVLSRLNRGFEVLGTEVRRRAEQDHVDAAVEKLPAGVEAHEAAIGTDLDLRSHLFILSQVGQALLQPIVEGIGHGDEPDLG